MALDLVHGHISKLYRSYVIPTFIAMTSNSLYCLADVFFVSKGSGSDGLAALNITMPLFTLFSAIGLIFGVGGASYMSMMEGANKQRERHVAFSMSVYSMLIIGFICSIVFTIWWKQTAYLFGGTPSLLPVIKAYMIPVAIASPLFIVMYASPILLRNDHAPTLAMLGALIGNITNIVLDWLFVLVFGMGIRGAAIATSLSTLLTLVIMAYHFISGKNTVHFVKPNNIQIYKQILRNGFGSGILEITSGCAVILFNFVILRYGNAIYLGAYAIVSNITYVVRGMLGGFAQGAQPLMAVNYGNGQMHRVKKAFRIALRYSLLFSISIYAIFYFFPKEIAALFANGDTKLIAYAGEGIQLYFSGLFCMAAMTVILYYFQSMNQGHMASILAFLKGFVCILLGLWLGMTFFGMKGMWLAVPFAESMTFVISIWIMRKPITK